MIKTKTAFIIFILLSIIIFPYYIVVITINSDFFNSIIPGWNTNIIGGRIILNLIKFLILSIVTFYYWKLSRVTTVIQLKKFTIHLLLTIPAVLISKINLYDLLHFNSIDPEIFMSQLRIIININIFLSFLFLLGQILFWIFYFRTKQKSNLTT
jgi:hypothetical protein